MSVSTLPLRTSPARVPGVLVAVVATLLLGLLAGLLVNPWAGAAVLALGLVVSARPLDPFVALLLAAGAAVFVEYGDPAVKRDLAVVLVLTLYALAGLGAVALSGRWGLPRSGLTRSLLALSATTGIALLHGAAAGNSLKFAGVEAFPLAALLFALAVGGLRLGPGHLRITVGVLVAAGLASAGVGFYVLATTGNRVGGMPFTPVPGLVALVLLNLVLRDPAPRPRLLPVLVICVLVMHQVLSFTRGFWLALLAGLPVSLLLYTGRGAGVGRRWVKVAQTVGLASLLLLAGGLCASVWLGWGGILGMLGGRFASSFETRNTPETVSNIVRLIELRTSLRLIAQAPLLGYGHGFTLTVPQFFLAIPHVGPQWWVHQSYVMIWLKQGILGLLALGWVLVAALRLGLRRATHADPAVAGWGAAGAACTVFVIVLGLTKYFFFMVTQNFVIALVWGIVLALGEPERVRWVWRSPRAAGLEAVPAEGGGAGAGA